MGRTKNTDYCLYGCGIIRQRIGVLAQAARRVSAKWRPDDVHAMRVSCRRLATAMSVFGHCLIEPSDWRRPISKVRKAMGELRDTDIQIQFLKELRGSPHSDDQRLGLERIAKRLQKCRAKRRQRAEEAIKSTKLPGLARIWRSAMCSAANGEPRPRPAQVLKQARRTLHPLYEKFLSYQRHVNARANMDHLHPMRIAAKRLRYGCELFAPLVGDRLDGQIDALKQIQDMLGQLHDAMVWADDLSRLVEKERRRCVKQSGNDRAMRPLMPGIRFIQADRRRAMHRLHREFIMLWRDISRSGLLRDLHKRLSPEAAAPAGAASAQECQEMSE